MKKLLTKIYDDRLRKQLLSIITLYSLFDATTSVPEAPLYAETAGAQIQMYIYHHLIREFTYTSHKNPMARYVYTLCSLYSAREIALKNKMRIACFGYNKNR